MSNDNNKTVDEILNEAYEEVLNEGLWDRFKSGAAGVKQSMTNAPKKVGNAISGATSALKAGAAFATNDDAAAQTNRQDAQSKFNANKNMQTGADKKSETLADSHKAKVDAFVKDTTAKIEALKKDAENDFAKQDPKTSAKHLQSYQKSIEPAIAGLIQALKTAYAPNAGGYTPPQQKAAPAAPAAPSAPAKLGSAPQAKPKLNTAPKPNYRPTLKK